MDADLWTCPECGRQFANKNQWHSCIELALEEHLATKTDHAVELYRAFESAVRDCGEFRIHPQKTRIAFITTMTFASATLAQRWINAALILPTPISDARITTIEMYGPTSFRHTMQVSEPRDLDTQVRSWLCESHRRGRQETLHPRGDLDPVTGLALQKLMIPLRANVITVGGDLALQVPDYAAAAFEAHPEVVARIGKTNLAGTVVWQGIGQVLPAKPGALRTLGLGAGEKTDVYLRSDL